MAHLRHDDFDHVHRCATDAMFEFAHAAAAEASRHSAEAEPIDCLAATLFELAGSAEDRGRLLAHGLAALAEVERRLTDGPRP